MARVPCVKVARIASFAFPFDYTAQDVVKIHIDIFDCGKIQAQGLRRQRVKFA